MASTVLIVDDDAKFREFVKRLLGTAASVAGEAKDADEAVSLALELAPRIVLVDVELPGGGLEVVRRIKSARAETRVVLLTGHAEEAYLNSTGKSGADVLLPKRDVRARLLGVIRHLESSDKGWDGCERRIGMKRERSEWDGRERRRKWQGGGPTAKT